MKIEDITSVENRKKWIKTNAHIINDGFTSFIKKILFDKSYVDDVVQGVINDFMNKIWINKEWYFNLDKMPIIKTIDDLFTKNMPLVMTWLYSNKSKERVLDKLAELTGTKIIKKTDQDSIEEADTDMNHVVEEAYTKKIETVRFGLDEENQIEDNSSEINFESRQNAEKLCDSIDTLNKTSNKTILSAFLSHKDTNSILEYIKQNEIAYKTQELHSEEIKRTEYWVNALFRMCIIIGKSSYENFSDEEKDIIKHAFLTATEEDKKFIRADKLYGDLSSTECKKIRKSVTTTLTKDYCSVKEMKKGQYTHIKYKDEFLLNLFCRLFSDNGKRDLESRTIKECLCLGK